jgi:hypothetical protein
MEVQMRVLYFMLSLLCVLGLSEARAESWGAVSLSNDGEGAWNWNKPTRQEAIESAVEACKKQSKLPDRCVTGVDVAKDNQWVFGVQCQSPEWRTAFVDVADTAKQAIVKVYKRALSTDTKYTKNQCRVRAFTTGNGTHLKYRTGS